MDNKEVTPQSQKALTKKCFNLLGKLKGKDSYTLNKGEMDTAIRALSCLCVL